MSKPSKETQAIRDAMKDYPGVRTIRKSRSYGESVVSIVFAKRPLGDEMIGTEYPWRGTSKKDWYSVKKTDLKAFDKLQAIFQKALPSESFYVWYYPSGPSNIDGQVNEKPTIEICFT